MKYTQTHTRKEKKYKRKGVGGLGIELSVLVSILSTWGGGGLT